MKKLQHNAKENLTQIAMLSKAAEADGFAFTDEMQQEVDQTLAQFKENAATNGMTLGSYLKAAFGKNMTTATVKNILKNATLASSFAQHHSDSLTYTEDELTDAYLEHLDDYDVVSYESIFFNGTAASTTDAEGNTVEPSEEESAAAQAAAQEAMARYENGEGLEEIAEDLENASYSQQDAATYTDTVVTRWLFDETRQAGDAELLDSDSSFYLVVFHSRGRNDYNTVDARHILFLVDSSALDSASKTYDVELEKLKEEARTKAEETLQQWKDGEATEESFAALAGELSEDPGSQANGGLYEQIYHDQMVQSNDWCFDPVRKTGDTGIVETSYGYHIMYFVGQNDPYWQVQVGNTLRTEAQTQWLETLVADVTAETGSGMRYVG